MITTKQCLQKKESLDTLSSVRDAVLAAAKAAKEAGRHDALEIALPTGKHVLTEPFVLSAKENPELSSIDLTIHGTFSEGTQVSSLTRLDGKAFTRAEGKPYFTYKIAKPKGAPRPSMRDLFLNFQRIPTTFSETWINQDPLTDEERSGKKKRRGFYAPLSLAEKLAEGPIGTTELVMYIEWECAILHVTGVDLTRRKTVDGVEMALLLINKKEMDTFCTSVPAFLNIGGRKMFVKNAPALLDEAENTYAFDAKAGILYLNPKDKVHMYCHAIEYPACDTLFYIEGMKNVRLHDITFTGVCSQYASQNLYYAGQANTMRGVSVPGGVPRGRLLTAAVLAADVRSFTVENCIFKDIGANGIQIKDRSASVLVRGSIFKNIGMCAVSVGNPTWHWQDEENRTFNLCIENNFFEHIAYEYPTSPCLCVGQVDGLKILHNTISDCAYSGMSVGWSWVPASFRPGEKCNIRNAEIAYNDIRGFMRLMRDGGAVYVVGGNADKDTCTRPLNFMHHNYAETEKGDVPDAKYGYYCDGASSHWSVSDSVIMGVRHPVFSQTHPTALSYHNHFNRIYSTTPVKSKSYAPARDVIISDFFLVEEGKDALLAKYPEADAIRKSAGCSLILP